MRKYIDAEKLKEEIQPLYEDAKEHAHFASQTGTSSDCAKYDEAKYIYEHILWLIDALQQKQPEGDLDKFTEKMDDWKARFNRPDDISIKATMAFTAKMFYMYPKAAREWYESLPKATMDNARKEESK